MGMLGWPPPTFWQSTLPELLAAHRGAQQRQHDAYWRAGAITAAVYNVNRAQGQDPLGPEDIFPFLLTAEERIAREWARIERQTLTTEESDNDD